MGKALMSVANATPNNARLKSYYGQDDCDIPAWSNTHTRGSGDNATNPDASDSNYFDEGFHITITATDGAWAVSLWSNDQGRHVIMWSPDASYSGDHIVPGSDGSNMDPAAILITSDGKYPRVYVNGW